MKYLCITIYRVNYQTMLLISNFRQTKHLSLDDVIENQNCDAVKQEYFF